MTEQPFFVSKSAEGHTCRCGEPAVRKIGEEILWDDPNPNRHNLTAYVCASCFAMVLGDFAARTVGLPSAPRASKTAAGGVDLGFLYVELQAVQAEYAKAEEFDELVDILVKEAKLLPPGAYGRTLLMYLTGRILGLKNQVHTKVQDDGN